MRVCEAGCRPEEIWHLDSCMHRVAYFLARRKDDGNCLCLDHRGFFQSATCLAGVGMICTLSAQKKIGRIFNSFSGSCIMNERPSRFQVMIDCNPWFST
mmetsp:Transcript_40787/g.98381  ORF Transcript_40787/g.98381 Transcript_40787/m.98381 type:complete len:99 (+) Transcript_40787:422-718(+)